MFGLFDDMFDDYYYQPRKPAPAPRRRQQTEEELYDELFGGIGRQTKKQQPAAKPEPKQEQTQKQMQKQEPARQKVQINAKQPVSAKTEPEQEKARKITTPPRKIDDHSDDSKITNREFIDPPEVAFKTYKPTNVILTVPQLMKPLDSAARQHIKHEAKQAVITLNNEEARQHIEIQASAKGRLTVVVGEGKLEYNLPAFYDRSDIKARRTESGIEIVVPLCGDEADDVMLVQIE